MVFTDLSTALSSLWCEDLTRSRRGRRLAAAPALSDGPGNQHSSVPAAGDERQGGARLAHDVTTHLKPGYVRRNGVPCGANAVLTEYWTTLSDEGADYLVVTNVLEDPQYLAQRYLRSVQFRKQRDNNGWHPTACENR